MGVRTLGKGGTLNAQELFVPPLSFDGSLFLHSMRSLTSPKEQWRRDGIAQCARCSQGVHYHNPWVSSSSTTFRKTRFTNDIRFLEVERERRCQADSFYLICVGIGPALYPRRRADSGSAVGTEERPF